jgi:hypothetical protein
MPREVIIGQALSEFPGGTFNWLIREVKWLRANMLPRKRGGGGIGDHFQFVRGVTTAAVLITDVAFQITVTDLIEQHAADPGSPLWVKAPGGGVVLSMGDEILAGYRENALTFDPGGGDVQVDWVQILAGSAASTPPLKRFELTANKTLASATATAKFLDDAGATTGGDLTLHDPEQQFSGRIANDLYTGSPGFRGIALLRTDLGAVEPDRWEIIGMERLAEFIVVEKYAPDTYKFVSNLSTRDDWWSLSPGTVAAGTIIPLNDPAEILENIGADQLIVARLSDPDTTVPTYDALSLYPNAATRALFLTPTEGDATGTVTVKSVDSVEVTLVDDTLKVKINYTSVKVFGLAGGSGSMEDTVDTTDCGA